MIYSAFFRVLISVDLRDIVPQIAADRYADERRRSTPSNYRKGRCIGRPQFEETQGMIPFFLYQSVWGMQKSFLLAKKFR